MFGGMFLKQKKTAIKTIPLSTMHYFAMSSGLNAPMMTTYLIFIYITMTRKYKRALQSPSHIPIITIFIVFNWNRKL